MSRPNDKTKDYVYEIKNKEGKVLYSASHEQFFSRRSGIDSFDLVVAEAIKKGVDLSGADFSGKDLSGADLRGGKFEGANFEGAILRETQLQGANLKNANFTNAKVKSIGAYGTDLENAVFNGAKLEGNWFMFCNVKNTDFTEVKSNDSVQLARLQELELIGAKIDQKLSTGRKALNPEAYQKEAYESFKKAQLKIKQELKAEKKNAAAPKFDIASIAKGKSR